MTKKERLIAEYRKARHALLERRRYWRKRGYDLPVPEIPKRTTEGSIRRLKGIGKKQLRPIGEIAPGKSKGVETPEISEEAIMWYDAIWNSIMAMIYGAPGKMSSDQAFYNPGAARNKATRPVRMIQQNGEKIKGILKEAEEKSPRRLIQQNGEKIEGILKEAEEKLGREEVIKRLREKYGDRISYELERLVYGMYDSQYSKWGARGFTTAINELKTALSIPLGV